MGHLAGKEIYQQLGLDNLPFRISKSKELYSILRSLYTADEAELIVKMPFGLSTDDQIGKIMGSKNIEFPSKVRYFVQIN